MNSSERNEQAKFKSVFVPGIARKLLKMGNPIADIKPLKENKEASIFIFEQTDKFIKDFAEVLSSFNKND